MTQLRLVGLTILLTALIWSSADQVGETTETFPVRISVVKDAQWIVSPDSRSCTVVFRGTNRAIQSLHGESADGMLVISRTAEELGLKPGRENLDLTNLVGSARVVADLGLEVAEIEPVTIQLDVDRLEPHRVPVVPLSAGAALAAPPEIDPPQVTATVPSRVWEANQSRLDIVYAQVSLDELIAAATAGQIISEQVPVVVPEALRGQAIRLDPPRVRVRFHVRDDRVSYTFKLVPIKVSSWLPAQQQLWVAELNPSVVDVTLEGPPESIERLRKEQQEVRLWLDVTTDDLANAGQPSRRQIQLSLPTWAEGVRLPSSSELPFVDFTVAKREPGG